ncbi:MAG: hypothetical protein J0I09_03920 [Sphingobacteriia bacterium]|nr:hypothetical protein [Sphingobacteriia bacterium]
MSEEYDIIDKIALNEGFPVWSKSIITSSSQIGNLQVMTTNISHGTNYPLGDTTIYIPLVLEGTSFVNSFIMATLNDTIKNLSLYRSKEYYKYGYNTITSKSAEKWHFSLCC